MAGEHVADDDESALGGAAIRVAVRWFVFYYDLLAPTPAENNKSIMRDDYLRLALQVIDDPTILVNVVSRRVKQLKRGNRPLVISLEKLSAEDTALREIAEGKITFELASEEEIASSNHAPVRNAARPAPAPSH